jgi:hypothetical protein
MSKADISTTPILPRRAVLAGMASAAVIPTAALGAAPSSDPIYAAIERHKAAMAPYDAAVAIRGAFRDADDDTGEEVERMDEAVYAAWESCTQAALDLINTQPTTLAGILAAIRVVQIQMRDDGIYMPQTLELDTGGDAQNTMGWIDAFLNTIADSAAVLDKARR